MEDEIPESIEYLFYADCHGLCSLTEFDPRHTFYLDQAILANPQRHGVYGIVELDPMIAEELKKLNPQVALNLIKGTKYKLPEGKTKQFLTRLELIPNPYLDPFGPVLDTVKESVQSKLNKIKEEDEFYDTDKEIHARCDERNNSGCEEDISKKSI